MGPDVVGSGVEGAGVVGSGVADVGAGVGKIGRKDATSACGVQNSDGTDGMTARVKEMTYPQIFSSFFTDVHRSRTLTYSLSA